MARTGAHAGSAPVGGGSRGQRPRARPFVIETGAVSDTNQTNAPSKPAADDASIGEVIDIVKAYAQQETIGPLKGAGRWLGFGFGAAFTMGLGFVFLLLGLLRLMQTEFDGWAAGGSWSWAPYLIVFVVAAVLLYFTIKRIQQTSLYKEPK